MQFDRMKRREFVTLLGGAATAFLTGPLAAWAQQANRPVRIGLLPFGSPSNVYDLSLVEAFRLGLRQIGLVENRDIVLDIVWTEAGDPGQAVAEVIQRGAELLVPTGSSASVAAKRRTSTIPIVFISVGNPIAMGLVESLSHPGGNATGFSDTLSDISAKLVQYAIEVSKPQAPIDYLWHTAWPDGKNRFQSTEQAAQSAGVKLRSQGIAESAEIDQAIAGMKQNGATTVIVQPSPFTYRERAHIISAANGLATLFGFPIAARDGALIAYGPDYIHMNRSAPLYVDRILKGTMPANLPVEQPTKIELRVNLKTAKALGLEVALSLLIRADELIE
jgi:putative ABC transport system substrate-binding protein